MTSYATDEIIGELQHEDRVFPCKLQIKFSTSTVEKTMA